MFLIIFKKNAGIDDMVFVFDKPLQFSEANRMLMDAVVKYKVTGKEILLKYRIVDMDTGEILFNSKIVLNQEITSLYSVITKNSNVPKQVIDFVSKIENGQIKEDITPIDQLNTQSQEQLEELECLNNEKQDILQKLKIQEKQSQLREIEYQQTLKRLQEEKERIENELKQREQEEQVKEAERLEKLKALEEKKKQAEEIANQKRLEDKKKKEAHEARLRALEKETSEAEYQLECITKEIQKQQAERQAQLNELEAKKKEAEREQDLRVAEEEKNNVEFKLKKMDLEHVENVEGKLEKSLVEGSSSIALQVPLPPKRPIDFKTSLLHVPGSLQKIKSTFMNVIIEQRRRKKEKQDIHLQVEKAKIAFLKELRRENIKELDPTSRNERMYQKEVAIYRNKYYKRKIIKIIINTLGIGLLFLVGKIIYDLYLVDSLTYPNLVKLIDQVVSFFLDIANYIGRKLDS